MLRFGRALRLTSSPTSALSRSNAIARSRVTLRDLGQIYDWVYYVWKPDFDKLWPPAKADRKTTEMSHRRKPGLPPTYEWPLVVAAELIRRAKAGERDPTAVAMIDHCETTFADKFSPGLKEMQVLLKKLLLGQF